jgi:tetratricopeptide (TPR) repeat protein
MNMLQQPAPAPCDAISARTVPDWRTLYEIARTLIARKRFEEAMEVAAQALALAPREPDLWLLAAIAAAGASLQSNAIAWCKQAIALRPNFAEAFVALGNALVAEKQVLAAAVCFERAVQHKPTSIAALHNLAATLLRLNRVNEARRCLERAIELDSTRAEPQHLLGAALLRLRETEAAERQFRAAIVLNPNAPSYWNSLGGILLQRSAIVEAEACYRRALALKPLYTEAHVNLATALYRLDRPAEMFAAYRRAIELDPACAGAQYNLALANLRAGRYREGWQGHEFRWKFAELRMRQRNFRQPQWQGETFVGKTLLLHAEQGFGDTIQFIRYAPMVAARGGRVAVLVQRPLARLLANFSSIGQIVPDGDPLPPFDLHCPLMSLPRLFDTTVETIPRAFPYLQISKEAVASAWQQWQGDGLRVGIAWAGNPSLRTDKLRSMPLSALLPITAIAGVRLFSLQKGPAAAELHATPGIADAASTFDDFEDTGAMISTLDLVLSVDTSVVHLAGALAIPVWVLLPKHPDWRWLEDRDDSPWYPTARLFRQRIQSGWDEVVERVRDALQNLLVTRTHSNRRAS